jgi:Asp/Glu/hydantoin racemase
MPREFPSATQLECILADGALAALNEGDAQQHDALIAQAALEAKRRGCGVVALAQFSMARAQMRVAAETGLPVLTTVDSAVRALKRRLGSQ